MRASHNLRDEKLIRPTFETRSQCINCGSSRLKSVWQAQFSDPLVHRFLVQFHYNADLSGLNDQSFRLVRCQACDMTFHQRILTSDWLKVLYTDWIDDTQIREFEADHLTLDPAVAQFSQARGMTRHLLRLRSLLPQKKSLRLLDYGCGDGAFLRLANSFGFEAYGIDFSETRSQRAIERGVSVMGSLPELEAYQSGPLSVITLFQVLEHLPDPVETLRQLCDRMEAGGIVVIEVPDCEGIAYPTTFDQFHAVQPLEHVNAFTPATLKDMCDRVGLIRIATPAAHVTTKTMDVIRTELGRVLPRSSTNQYFRKK